jgi:hypothetical protein
MRDVLEWLPTQRPAESTDSRLIAGSPPGRTELRPASSWVGWTLTLLWQWFADDVPSSAYGGWYTFPLPNPITTPAM